MFGRREKRRVILTKTGWVFVLFILLMQLAAFNTGENLFYLVTSGIISFLLLGWWASRKGLRHLGLSRTVPEAVHRGESFASMLRLSNENRVWPGVGISLGSSSWEHSLWVNSLPSGSVGEFRAYERMAKRGRHALPPVGLRTTFPFGLVERSVVVDDAQTILVYPRVYSLSKSVLDDIDDSGQTPKVSFNDGDEFFSLREYVPGDDIRHISWKISARMGRLIIRDLEPSISRMVVIVLDTRGVIRTGEDEEHFEMAVDLAASLAVALLGLHYIVGLEVPGGSVDMGRGRSQSTKILESLAEVGPAEATVYGDDWYGGKGEHADASRIFLSGDMAQWGLLMPRGRARVLDPREAMHG